MRWAQTNTFGYYRFAEVAAGETYILTVYGKWFMFVNPTLVINVTEEVDNINFVANLIKEEKFWRQFHKKVKSSRFSVCLSGKGKLKFELEAF